MKTHLRQLDVIIAFVIFLACCLISFMDDNEAAAQAVFTSLGN